MTKRTQNKQTTRVAKQEQGVSKTINTEELLTVSEVARRLRVDDTTVRRWIKSGALEAITLPHAGKRRGYRVRKHTLDSLLTGGIKA